MRFDFNDIYVLLVFLLLTLLSSCKTIQPVKQVEYRDSIRVIVKHDSVSVIEKDSVFVFQKNDTIYLTRQITKYKDRTAIKVDTCYLNREVKVVEQVQVVPPYYKRISWLFWVLVVCVIVYIAIKLIKWWYKI